jgi:hypothetical protein
MLWSPTPTPEVAKRRTESNLARHAGSAPSAGKRHIADTNRHDRAFPLPRWLANSPGPPPKQYSNGSWRMAPCSSHRKRHCHRAQSRWLKLKRTFNVRRFSRKPDPEMCNEHHCSAHAFLDSCRTVFHIHCWIKRARCKGRFRHSPSFHALERSTRRRNRWAIFMCPQVKRLAHFQSC